MYHDNNDPRDGMVNGSMLTIAADTSSFAELGEQSGLSLGWVYSKSILCRV
jgi:hypothetical protein